MNTIINIDGKAVKLNTALSWVYVFKSQFGVDPLPVFMPVIQGGLALFQSEGDAEKRSDAFDVLAGFGLSDALNLLWTFAKNEDKNLDPPEVWIKQFETLELDNILPDLAYCIISSFISRKKAEALRETIQNLTKSRAQ